MITLWGVFSREGGRKETKRNANGKSSFFYKFFACLRLHTQNINFHIQPATVDEGVRRGTVLTFISQTFFFLENLFTLLLILISPDEFHLGLCFCLIIFCCRKQSGKVPPTKLFFPHLVLHCSARSIVVCCCDINSEKQS